MRNEILVNGGAAYSYFRYICCLLHKIKCADFRVVMFYLQSNHTI